ncbi:MAG: MFS transporter [Phycisphaerales bacterium]|nr:MFS transporter [Phycisphaerales bacterium]
MALSIPALKEIVGDEFGANPFWTHAFMAINLVGAALAAPWIARMRGKCPLRGVATIALIGSGLLFLAMDQAPNLPTLFALRFCEGACHITALTCVLAIAAGSGAPRGRTMGTVGAAMMLGTAAGTRMGGVAWERWPEAMFVVACLLSLLAALLATLALGRSPAASTNDAPSISTPRVGLLSVFRQDPRVLTPWVFGFVDRFCVGVIISSFGLFLEAGHGLDPAQRSRALAMFLAPFALLIYPAGRFVDRVGPIGPLLGGSLGFGLVMSAYGFIPTSWLTGVMVLSGALSALMFTPTLTLCAQFAPPAGRAAAFAGFNAAGSLGFIAGPMLAGVIMQVIAPQVGEIAGYQIVFIVAGLAQAACVLAYVPLAQRAPRRCPAAT